jgi:hypothetical protein
VLLILTLLYAFCLLIIAATCPVCDTLRLHLHEAEGRRTVAESQRDQLTARIAALDTTQHHTINTNINHHDGTSGNSDRAVSAFNGSSSDTPHGVSVKEATTSVPSNDDGIR